MKTWVAIALLMTIGLASARIIINNGQPGCKTTAELQTKTYRNIWDPTAYWVCSQLGVPAGLARCDEGEAWYDSRKQCVEWDNWQWEDPINPPSKP